MTYDEIGTIMTERTLQFIDTLKKRDTTRSSEFDEMAQLYKRVREEIYDYAVNQVVSISNERHIIIGSDIFLKLEPQLNELTKKTASVLMSYSVKD